MIDIRKMPEVIDTINAILNGKGVAEVKGEDWKSGQKVLVVEQIRSVKFVYPPEYNKQ